MKTREANIAYNFYKNSLQFSSRAALNIKGKAYGYNQVNQLANLISNAIEKIDSKSKFITLLINKELEAYIGIIGILYSGKAYVPLSVKFPVLRILTMLNSTPSDIMIVSEESMLVFEKLLPLINKKMKFIFFRKELIRFKKKYPKHKFIHIDFNKNKNVKTNLKSIDGNEPAYLLFTSGSTGMPKGVSVSHRNVSSYLKNIDKKLNFSEKDNFSQTFDLNFDLSVHDMFVCWKNCACLFVPSETDMLLPVEYIKKNKISVWFSVPSLAMIIDNYGRLTKKIFPNIRYSLFCGEALPESLAKKWSQAASNSKVVNLYGPTEATIAISIFFYEEVEKDKDFKNGIVPIGKLFDDQNGLLLNELNKEVDEGESGELCVSGSQVTEGYLNNIEKTKSQYIKLSHDSKSLWYKTGDCVIKNKFGNYCYLNRIDNQVKINGNRVELGEIEQILREISNTSMVCVVTIKESKRLTDQIIAFIAGSKEDESSILFHCNSKLPKYMIPNKIKFIENMPLNINGKIDRLKLKKIARE